MKTFHFDCIGSQGTLVEFVDWLVGKRLHDDGHGKLPNYLGMFLYPSETSYEYKNYKVCEAEIVSSRYMPYEGETRAIVRVKCKK